MENPRGFLLAETPLTEGWFKDADQRLVSERRFIVAALRMGLELTNSLSENQRESYKAQFAHSGLHQEMTRLQVAVRTVQDEEGTVGHLFTDTNQHKFAEVSIC